MYFPGGRARLRAAGAAGLVAAALMVTACGSSGAGPGVAQLPADSIATASPRSAGRPSGGGSVQQRELEFARCMRSHRVPSFPDPNSQGVFPPGQVQRLKGSALAKAAFAACEDDLPVPARSLPTSQDQADVLRFAECMRSHGVPDFPEPGSGSASPSPSLDPASPQFQRATRDCRSKLPAGTGSSGG